MIICPSDTTMLPRTYACYLRLVLVAATFPILSRAQDATAIATAAPAASPSVVPVCAQSCAQMAQQAQTQCTETDQSCLCQHSSAIQKEISSCLEKSKSCSTNDKHIAIAYYPQFCAHYGLASSDTAATTGPNGIITAAGQAPTQANGVGANSLVLAGTASGTTATETADPANNGHSGPVLAVPAILGITLGVFLLVCIIAAFIVYAHIRRRQLKRRTRLEFLTTELGDSLMRLDPPPMAQRPPRSRSINSHFMVQPTPPAKPHEDFDFGLSRTSTLVSIAPPPPSKVDKNKDLPDIRVSAYEETQGTGRESGAISPVSVEAPRRSTLKSFIEHKGKKLRLSIFGRQSTSMGGTTNDCEQEAAFPPPRKSSKNDEFDEKNKI